MQRTLSLIILFALAVALATVVSAVLAYRGVRQALESDFETHLTQMAATQQITPDEVAEIRLLREDAMAYLDVQAQLNTLRSATGVENVALLDSAGLSLVDVRHVQREGSRSPFDSLAHADVVRAVSGATAVSGPYRRGDTEYRAAFAPVRAGRGRAIGVVALEAATAYTRPLADLRRTLLGIALVTVLAIGLLALLVVRQALAAARLERRLSRSENLAAMGRLTATLAHEIKNPLAIIRGSAQRLGKLDPEAQRMADFVVEESDRLTKTVSRYLQFARGEQTPSETGDAVATLEATIDLLEGEARARGLTVERIGAFPAAAPVGLDNESLKQLYLNLMLNAFEAMGKGGRVRVSAAQHGARFEFAIADEGPGIPAEILARIGSPFVTTKPQGSGLGLFLAARLARAAGGELTVANGAERGAVCTVRLPARKVQA